MSQERCEKHNQTWDNDETASCPQCEDEDALEFMLNVASMEAVK